MQYKAVIFDLFGTLVDNLHHVAFTQILADTAALLNVPAGPFVHLWRIETWEKRATGALTTVGAIEYICHQLGTNPSPELLQQAAELRYRFTRNALIPRTGAVETLATLKAAGYRLGLISDLTEDSAAQWPQTALAPLIDVAILSCAEGLKKPDPRIFLLACERLGVEPANCLYMGDGGSDELRGARAVGMYPVMIRAPYETEENTNQHVRVRVWDGPRISAVSEILAYVDPNLKLAGLDEDAQKSPQAAV
jgi:putative hydrolase of the HAD superfamily